ncbi:hypothetical protein HUJ05_009988 [Dendroctonus ponderosae]|nr:hypothetical protein HUJ05_009988 [Dendroctonus ponderosae]
MYSAATDDDKRVVENIVEASVFVPSLIWHAGAIAQSIRTIAVTCLSYAIAPVKGINLFNSSADLKPLVEKLIPLLLSLLEDASQESRKKSIECLTLIKKNCVEKDIWSNDDLISIYPDVMQIVSEIDNKKMDTIHTCLLAATKFSSVNENMLDWYGISLSPNIAVKYSTTSECVVVVKL